MIVSVGLVVSYPVWCCFDDCRDCCVLLFSYVVVVSVIVSVIVGFSGSYSVLWRIVQGCCGTCCRRVGQSLGAGVNRRVEYRAFRVAHASWCAAWFG